MFAKPIHLLRLEALGFLALCLGLYAYFSFSWPIFILCLFVPDLAMLGYLKDNHTGARLYNLVHSNIAPLALGALGFFTHNASLLMFALIWLSHIALDRTLAYGLKFPNAFKNTHLSPLTRDLKPQKHG